MGYSSGQRGQTVNLLAYAFQGSNPCPTTNPKKPVFTGFFRVFRGCAFCVKAAVARKHADAIRSCVGHMVPEWLERAAGGAFAEGLVTDEELKDI